MKKKLIIGNIGKLEAGFSTSLESGTFFGNCKIKVTVTAWADNADEVSRIGTGRLMGNWITFIKIHSHPRPYTKDPLAFIRLIRLSQFSKQIG